MSVNKVLLVGNLGKDPELRYTPAGVAVASFSLATTEKYKDKEGQQVEKTEWHNIVVWRGLAEVCGKYLTKGKQVYIEGKITTKDWEDNEGVKKYKTEIVAENMQMLGGKSDNQQGGNSGNQQNNQQPQQNTGSSWGGQNQQQGQQQQQSGSFNNPPFNPDDDIPF